MGRACTSSTHVKEEEKNVYRIFVRKPEGKRLLGRPARSWVDNINMDLR
jgi:hypothetical protein